MPVLRKIVVQDFRNIRFQEVAFSPNVNCISGSNGAGKTNLLDAIYYLSMTKSAFPAPDRSNWRYGTEGFTVGGTYAMENGLESRFSLKVGADGKKLVRDEKPCPRLADHIGLLPVVMITPSDAALVSDSGEERRRLSNAVLSQMDREYLSAAQTYARLLAQRNRLLRDGLRDWDLLAVLDRQMEGAAHTLFRARRQLSEDLNPLVTDYYRIISGGRETVEVTYRSDLSEGPLTALFAARRERDLALGYTSCGAQRDDFLFGLDGHPIRRAGSQGQQKSFLLALKFAQYEIMKKSYGFAPLLLLDDVFDKLDLDRIAHLVGLVSGTDFGQIFITDTDPVRIRAIVDRLTEDRAYFNAAGGAFTRVEAS